MISNTLIKSLPGLLLAIGCFASGAGVGQGVTVTSGCNLVINGNVNLIIQDGGFNNGGTFTPGTGTVTFSGTANSAITTIGGSSLLNFYNLGFNKSAGNAKLGKSISVANNVLMQQGNLDLSTFDLDLGTTGNIAGESATSSINGPAGGGVLRTVSLNAPGGVNPGNLGIEITSLANLGLTTIKRGHQQPISPSGHGINRYFDITPANNTALNATLKLYYFDSELAGINESELKLWSSANNGATWSLLGADAQDATTNYVLKNGIPQFKRFTLASSVTNPLPVRFISFNGQISGDNIILKWSTGFEFNNDHFELERSFDGRKFTAFAKVSASNNPNGFAYQSTDVNAFTNGAVYYRIKQVNKDGTYSYTNVIFFTKGAYASKLIGVYPNPSNGLVQLRFTATGEVKTTMLQVIDSRGAVVATKQLSIKAGLNDIPYDIGQLAQGVYIIKLLGLDNQGITIIKK